MSDYAIRLQALYIEAVAHGFTGTAEAVVKMLVEEVQR